MKVLILGAGKMTSGILEGLKNETDLSQFSIYSPSGKSAKELARSVGANFIQSLDGIKDPTWVWIGCKPQQLNDLATTIQGKFSSATFVSMLAAIPEETQRKILGVNRLVRIMPNLPVQYKKGITLISSLSSPADIKAVKNLFSLVGLAQEVTEEELEELTILTGSGPALFYEFTKVLGESFTSLNQESREDLARMVLAGSAASATLSSDKLADMIDAVTSKAGVTIAVLEQWRKLRLNELIQDGVTRGKKRTEEIKAHLPQK